MSDMFSWPSWTVISMGLVNFVLCVIIVGACVQRISMMSFENTQTKFRIAYVLFLVVATSSGLSGPLWGEIAGPGQVGMAVGAIFFIWASYSNWRDGIPDFMRKEPKPG